MLVKDASGRDQAPRAWWRHQMETFSALLAICAGNSPVPGEFPTQRPVTRSFDVYFDLRPNKWLSKQSWGWWFETLSCSLWRHRNGMSQNERRNFALCCYDVVMKWLYYISSWCIHVVYLPTYFGVTSLTLGQSYDCPSVSEMTLKDMGKNVH